MSAATFSTFARVRPETATRAPAPVTIATRPCSLPMLVLSPTWPSAGALGRRPLDVLTEQVALQQLLRRAGERDLAPSQHIRGRRDGERPRSELVDDQDGAAPC